EDEQRDLVEVRVWIALGQEPCQRTERGEPRERQRILHGKSRIALTQLYCEITELIGEPGFPGRLDVIANLQHGTEAPAPAAVHETEVSAMGARQQLEDRGGFAMRPDRQND